MKSQDKEMHFVQNVFEGTYLYKATWIEERPSMGSSV
jgi:hypothetical protein